MGGHSLKLISCSNVCDHCSSLQSRLIQYTQYTQSKDTDLDAPSFALIAKELGIPDTHLSSGARLLAYFGVHTAIPSDYIFPVAAAPAVAAVAAAVDVMTAPSIAPSIVPSIVNASAAVPSTSANVPTLSSPVKDEPIPVVGHASRTKILESGIGRNKKRVAIDDMCNKSKVTLQMRAFGLYNVISLEQCPELLLFNRQMSTIRPGQVSLATKFIARVLHWCLTHDDAGVEIDDVADDVAVPYQLLFQGKRVAQFMQRAVDARCTSSTLRSYTEYIVKFLQFVKNRWNDDHPGEAFPDAILYAQALDSFAETKKSKQQQTRNQGRVNTMERLQDGVRMSKVMPRILVLVDTWFKSMQCQLDSLIALGPRAMRSVPVELLAYFSAAIAVHITILNSARPAVASNMMVSEFCNTVQLLAGERYVSGTPYCYIPVAEHNTGSKMTACISLNSDEFKYYNAYFKYVRPVLADLCCMYYEQATTSIDADKKVKKGGLKHPIDYHLDRFILNAKGFSMQEVSKVVPRVLEHQCNIMHTYCPTSRDVRNFISSEAESSSMSREERGHLARYLCHDVQTAAENYVAPSIEGVLAWKTAFDKLMPGAPGMHKPVFVDDATLVRNKDVEILKAHPALTYIKYFSFVMYSHTKQLPTCEVSLNSFLVRHKFSVKAKDLHSIYMYIRNEMQLMTFIDKSSHLTRTRGGRIMTPTELAAKVSRLGSRVATSMILTHRYENGRYLTADSPHELCIRSTQRLWPLVVIKPAFASNGIEIGDGGYARDDIPVVGTIVCEYYIHKKWNSKINKDDQKEYDNRPTPGCNYCIVSQFGKLYYDAWGTDDNKGMKLNHSAIHPNCEICIRTMGSAVGTIVKEYIFIRTTRVIHRGEQLVWNYLGESTKTGRISSAPGKGTHKDDADFLTQCVGGCLRCKSVAAQAAVTQRRAKALRNDRFQHSAELLDMYRACGSSRAHGSALRDGDTSSAEDSSDSDSSDSSVPDPSDSSDSSVPKHSDSSDSSVPTHSDSSDSSVPTHSDSSDSSVPTHSDSSDSSVPTHSDSSDSSVPTHSDSSDSSVPTHSDSSDSSCRQSTSQSVKQSTTQQTIKLRRVDGKVTLSSSSSPFNPITYSKKPNKSPIKQTQGVISLERGASGETNMRTQRKLPRRLHAIVNTQSTTRNHTTSDQLNIKVEQLTKRAKRKFKLAASKVKHIPTKKNPIDKRKHESSSDDDDVPLITRPSAKRRCESSSDEDDTPLSKI